MGLFDGMGGGNGGQIDPATMGILAMFAGSNPETAAPLLTSMGVPVPQLPNGIPSVPGTTLPTTGALQPQATGALPTPLSVGGSGTQAQGNSPLSALAGVKAPAPLQPIMQGGVAGGVKPPEVMAASKVGTPAIDALMAALLGGGGPAKVPTLGEYIRGGKY